MAEVCSTICRVQAQEVAVAAAFAAAFEFVAAFAAFVVAVAEVDSMFLADF
jgi:hypothetical protein